MALIKCHRGFMFNLLIKGNDVARMVFSIKSLLDENLNPHINKR